MAEAGGSGDQHEKSSTHVPTFSVHHPMIPRLYVMPWKQDMKNQRLLLTNAALAQIPVLPQEETLCLSGRERLCHSQKCIHPPTSSSPSSSSIPLIQNGLTAHNSSHFSRYNSSVVTTRRLYRR